MEKSNKKRVLAWIIGIVVFVGIIIGAICIKNAIDNNDPNKQYVKVIQSRYEKVDETLMRRINEDTYTSIINKKVTTIKFDDPTETDIQLVLYIEGEYKNEQHQGKATYTVSLSYYNSLVDAEESGNMISYLDALNQVCEKMDFVNCNFNDKIKPIKYNGCSEEKSEKINELFALDFEKEGIVKQVAFLPYRIEVLKYELNDEDSIFYYTYKISGISYCQTADENSDTIEQSDALISDKSYNPNHIKAYYRDIEYSSSIIANKHSEYVSELQYDIVDFVNNLKTKSEIEIKTTYFEETTVFNVMKEYENMKKRNFDYRKPDNVDMREYTK